MKQKGVKCDVKTLNYIYIYSLYVQLYINLVVATNQKSIIDAHEKRERNPNITLKVEERNKNYKNNQKMINKIAISTYLSITTLNVNRLNDPIKRHRVAEGIQKQDPSICCLQETHFRSKDTD